MEIITENGKDYLNTFIAKLDNENIDTSPFFVEIQECINSILRKYNYRHKTNYTYIDKNNYGYNIQSILNRFSGNYFSASFMKSYETNPATCFYSMLCKEEKTDATAIGSAAHKILEEYYTLPPNERSYEKLDDITNRLTNVRQVKDYINNYKQIPDYLNNDNEYKKLDCVCEYSNRSKLYIPKFDVHLPECAYVIDRIDFREDKIYIVDYKTGVVNKNSFTFDGNLGQMIIYKWAVEQKLREGVDKVFICSLKNKEYTEVDCSEENQKILIDRINQFFTQFKKDNRTRIYKYTDKGYFTNNDLREFRNIMNDGSITMAKIPVKVYIGDQKDREN